MDMAFITAINASDSFPPHDPWMSGETLNYYYLGHVLFAWPIQLLGLRPDAGYLLSWGVLLALTCHRRVRVLRHALGRRARVARRPRAARRAGARGDRRRGAGRDPRQPRRRAVLDPGRGPAQGLRVVRPVARDPGHDQRVPVVLVHPRRPARARDRAAVHGARDRLRHAGRAARAARRRAVALGARRRSRRRSPSARCTRSTRGRTRSPRGCWRRRVVVWLRTDEARGRTGYAIVWLALVLVAELRALHAVPAELRPRVARDRDRRDAPRRSTSGWATWR